MENIKADAASYLLTVMLQHLEVKHPGMLQEMIEGVQSDQSVLTGEASENEHIQQVFQEALGMLTRAKCLIDDEPQS